jgi:hypothetical protein
MLTANGATMANLTTALSLIPGVDRIVVDRTSGRVDVLVIDRVTQPTPNWHWRG